MRSEIALSSDRRCATFTLESVYLNDEVLNLNGDAFCLNGEALNLNDEVLNLNGDAFCLNGEVLNLNDEALNLNGESVLSQ